TRLDPVQPPPIPPRRLFQIPDYWGWQAGGPGPPSTVPSQTVPPSNASSAYNFDTHAAQDNNATGDPAVNNLVASPARANPAADLTAPITPANPTAGTPAIAIYLGGAPPTATAPPYDQRDHPYFRTEWLQKVANLTTVR